MRSYSERHGKVNPENNGGKKQKRRELIASINITPTEMESIMKSKLVTSTQLNGMVYSIFKEHCPEIEGCWVDVGPTGVSCELYFSFIDKPEEEMAKDGKIKVVQLRGQNKNGNSAYADIERYNNRMKRASVFELTEGGKDTLSEFVSLRYFTDVNQNRVDWKKVVTEAAESDIYGRTRTYVKVAIDMERVLQKVYGKTSENGEDYLYMINPSRPITTYQGANGNMFTSNWLFSINQMNRKVLSDVMDQSGLQMNTAGSLNMYRG